MATFSKFCAILGGLWLLSLPDTAMAASPFDGSWNVVVACETVSDAHAYDWKFAVIVKDGALSGRYDGSDGSLGVLTGKIRPDGTALLQMSGLTGRREYSVGNVVPGTKFKYTATIRFDARSGYGKRNELRPCGLTFTKG